MVKDVTHGGVDLQEMLREGSEFRKLEVPYYIKAGASVYPYFDGVYDIDLLLSLKRPLVMGERILTTGLCGELRLGTIVKICNNGKQATADDGSCFLFLYFDRDADHEWTMNQIGMKGVVDRHGNWVRR